MPTPSQVARRRLIAFAGIVVASGLTVVAATLPSILGPENGGRVVSDAVFVHVGGRGERLDASLRLIEEGVAGVLVIPTSPTEQWPEAQSLCESDAPFEVVCIDSIPANTRDEALVLAELVAARAWGRVTIVTNDYHMARATMVDRSCTTAELVPVPVAPWDLGPFSHGWKILHEVIAIPYYWAVQRCES